VVRCKVEMEVQHALTAGGGGGWQGFDDGVLAR
jgi:hypothetical protein